MLVTLFAFAVGVVTGAFSHKWLAVETKTVTGLDAQAVADKAKAAVKSVAPKV